MSNIYPKFGKLSVIEVKKYPNGERCRCLCDCGKEIWLQKKLLVHGNNKSCGCIRQQSYIGHKFGSLIVVNEIMKPSGSKIRKYCICKCDCGKESTVVLSKLLNGNTRSCGCARRNNHKGYGESSKNYVINHYKNGAKNRNLIIQLSDLEIEQYITSNCFYCGSPPSRIVNHKRRYGEFICNGIDRKDSSKGYTTDNCVTACTKCNFMKSKMTYSDFINQCKLIAKNLG